jgi:hypothetical protein
MWLIVRSRVVVFLCLGELTLVTVVPASGCVRASVGGCGCVLWVRGCVNECVGGWVRGCVVGWLVGRVGVWVVGWVVGYVVECVCDWLVGWLVE